MNIYFSAPSKTFLAGEYAVLNNGPALVLCTQPLFTFIAESGSGILTGIPLESPAQIFLEKHKNLWRDWDLKFNDPHAGQGGFGASGAQFLFAHVFVTLMRSSVKEAIAGLDLRSLLADYKAVHQGSGVDILAQATGGVARVALGGSEPMSWPYPELEFAIVRTGQKVPTHQHVAELDVESLKVLNAPAVRVVEAFGNRSSADFVSELCAFSAMLRAMDLQVCKPLLAEIEKESWCIASKGCGALGADTILVFFAPGDRQKARDYFSARDMKWVATSSDLTGGIKMEWGRA